MCRTAKLLLDLRDVAEKKQDRNDHPNRMRALDLEFKPLSANFDDTKEDSLLPVRSKPSPLPQGAASSEKKVIYIPLIPRHAVGRVINNNASRRQKFLYLLYSHVCCSRRRAAQSLLPAFWSIGLKGLNSLLMEHSHIRVCAVLKEIAEAKGAALVFFCSAGKDRTGYISALLLHILGVSRAQIVHDYSLSASLLPAKYHSAIMNMNAPAEWLHSPPEIIEFVLSHLETEHGSVDSYLDKLGFSHEWRQKIRDSYLEDIRTQCVREEPFPL